MGHPLSFALFLRHLLPPSQCFFPLLLSTLIFHYFSALILSCARSAPRHFEQLVTLPMDDVIPVTLKSTLERVCRKFFNRDAAHKSPKHQRFVELYQATFEKDFEARKG